MEPPFESFLLGDLPEIGSVRRVGTIWHGRAFSMWRAKAACSLMECENQAMKKGKIVEAGNHEDLMEKKGRYFELDEITK